MARPNRSENIREKLLKKGRQLFLSQSYHGTGIKEVVAQANVLKGSLPN